MRMRSLLPLLLAVTVVAGGAVTRDAAAQGSGKPAYGDTLIDSLLGNVSSLIPNITNDVASHEVGNLLYSGLVTFDRDMNPVGDLAESWKFSKDCLDLTFNLRKGVKWHDGKPFSAADVVFTYEAMIDPKTPNPYRSDFDEVESVKALDPQTIRVRYRQPYGPALRSWGTSILPKHLLETWVQNGKIKEAPQNFDQPIGTGPYRFVEFRSGDKVVLLSNADYFKGRPHISRVVFRVIPSQATTFLELKAKGVDAAMLTALQYARQTDYPAFKKDYTRYRYAGNRYTYLGFNLKDPRFSDKRVRYAFAHAIDKRQIIEGVLLGLGRDATAPYKPGSWAYTDKVKSYAYDPAKARKLLAEAGWKETNAEGILVKDGKPFAFELVTNQGNDERRKVAEIIQASLREIGVAVEIRIIEWATLLKNHIKTRAFEAIVLGWQLGVDPDQYFIWHSSQMGPDQLNSIQFANAEADAQLEGGRTSCVQADRVKHYHRLQQVLAEEQPVVFLYFGDQLPAVSARVHGIDPGPNGIRYNFPDWYVPKGQQRYTP
ncbi:MAG: peptide-binding protein [Candidatus Rokuibacteriota bacterium]